ncbi:hypothetical protein JCM8547_007505 [Rhodosporidiobolus lusitaniae]
MLTNLVPLFSSPTSLPATLPPEQPSLLLSLLPSELLLLILSQLSYFDLLRARSTCRALRELCLDPSLKSAFFLTPPTPETAGNLQPGPGIDIHVSIHPFLHTIDGLVTSPSFVSFLPSSPSSPFSSPPPSNGKERNALSSPETTKREYATQPAAKQVLVDLSYGVVCVSPSRSSEGEVGEGGVTVHDVLLSLLSYWTTLTDPAGAISKPLSSTSLSEKEQREIGIARWSRVGKIRWKGWKRAWRRWDGVVVMEASFGWGSSGGGGGGKM